MQTQSLDTEVVRPKAFNERMSFWIRNEESSLLHLVFIMYETFAFYFILVWKRLKGKN